MQVSTNGPTVTLSCQSHSWHNFGGKKLGPKHTHQHSTAKPQKAYGEKLRGTKPVGLKAWVTSEPASHKEKQLINHHALAITRKRRQILLPNLNMKKNCVTNVEGKKKKAQLQLVNWPRAHSCQQLPSEDGLSKVGKAQEHPLGKWVCMQRAAGRTQLSPNVLNHSSGGLRLTAFSFFLPSPPMPT